MNLWKRIAAIVCSVTVVSILAAAAQTSSKKPAFEVVSIKPSPPDLTMRGGGPRGDRLVLTGASLKMLLGMAYRNGGDALGSAMDVIGGPDWLESALYDVQAKADCSGGIISRDQLMLMVRSMLEDRFQLKAHVETREQSVYNLVVAKEERLPASTDQTPPPISVTAGQACGEAPEAAARAALPPPPAPGQPFDMSQLPRGAVLMMLEPGALRLQASAAPVSQLVSLLRQTTGRTVIDKTGLTGLFDFSMRFSTDGLAMAGMGRVGPPPPGAGPRGGGPAPGGAFAGPPPEAVPAAADPVPSLFSAIQDLGLRLQDGRGPVDVLVIDSVQKPSEN